MSRIATLFATTAVTVLVSGAVIAGPQQSGAQTQPPAQPRTGQTQMADRDEDFIKDVAQSSQVEIESSKLAMTKAMSPEVKAFAEQLVKDHEASSKELMDLVHAKNAMWPPDDPGLKAKKQKHESLQTLTGAAFDKEYLEDMISDHESSMARFGRQREYGKDAQIKAFVEKITPKLQEHLKMARDLRAKIK